MTLTNKTVQDFLAFEGVKARVKYIRTGSLKGCFRIYNNTVSWWDNIELQNKLNMLGFKDFDNRPLSRHSGNGGSFHIFSRNDQLIKILKDNNLFVNFAQ